MILSTQYTIEKVQTNLNDRLIICLHDLFSLFTPLSGFAFRNFFVCFIIEKKFKSSHLLQGLITPRSCLADHFYGAQWNLHAALKIPIII